MLTIATLATLVLPLYVAMNPTVLEPFESSITLVATSNRTIEEFPYKRMFAFQAHTTPCLPVPTPYNSSSYGVPETDTDPDSLPRMDFPEVLENDNSILRILHDKTITVCADHLALRIVTFLVFMTLMALSHLIFAIISSVVSPPDDLTYVFTDLLICELSIYLTPLVVLAFVYVWLKFLGRVLTLVRLFFTSTRVAPLVLTPVLEVSLKPGSPQACGKTTFIHSTYHYPVVVLKWWYCVCYPALAWRPLFPREVNLEFDIDVAPLAGAIVSNLTTPAPSQERVLEMSTPYSRFYSCSRPKHMAIIHCSPAGSVDLSAYPYACIGRVADGLTSYAVTATHVLRDLSVHSAASGNPVMIRVESPIGLRDIPFPINEYEIYATSKVSDLDVTFLEVPMKQWSVLGLKAAKCTNKLTIKTSVTVYTPLPNSTWRKAVGAVSDVHSLFRIRHTASTDFGASGGFVMTGNSVACIHTGRHPESSSNLATALIPFVSRKTTESWPEDQRLWREQEREWEEEQDNRDYYDQYDEYDDDHGYDDDDGDDRYVAQIYGKAGHRAFRSAGQAEYTEELKEQNWQTHHGYGDAFFESSRLTSSIALTEHRETSWTGYPRQKTVQDPVPLVEQRESLRSEHPVLVAPKQPPARESHPTEMKVSGGHDEKEPVSSPAPPPSPTTPPTHLNGEGSASPLKACKKVSEGTGGKSKKNPITTSSSAQPSADSLPRDGKKRKRQRRKRKPKSQASPSGTPPTDPIEPPKLASITKQLSELQASLLTLLPSKQPETKSTNDTPDPNAPKASAKKRMGKKKNGSAKKSYAAAVAGSSTETSPKTPNQASPTVSSAQTTETSSSKTQN
jgi:hypothetical protein